MTTAALKREIQKTIENINDNHLLEAVYTILNNATNYTNYELSREDMNIVEERKRNYKAGKMKTYSVAEVKKKILKNLGK
jgi:hypothetical protein